MFKSILIYRISDTWTPPELKVLAEALGTDTFEPCTPSQEMSCGWVPPRNEDNAPLVECIGGQLVMKLALERKSVPGSAVKAALDERCKLLEQERGRAPGRREKKELKEEIYLELLPRAFSKHSRCLVWIDPDNKWLVLGTASYSAADLLITQLVTSFAKTGAQLEAVAALSTQMSPAAAMSHWLVTQEPPYNFSVDRELELKAPDDTGACVKYAKHSLDIAEVVGHIQAGKVPTKLALTWGSKISFVLTDKLQVTKLGFLDALFAENEEGGFDADVAIATGGLKLLIPDLVEALGGELPAGQPAPESNSPADPEQGN